MDRRTKIVATIGPASRSRGPLGGLIKAGVDVVRLNFAHDKLEAHEEAAALARELASEQSRVVGVLVDLPGPKMRIGEIAGGEVELRPGDSFVLTGKDILGDSAECSTTVDGLSGMVDAGEEILLNDGQLILQVEAVKGEDVHTTVIRGGTLRSRKGMHVPGAERSVEAFTEDDREALKGALELKADLIGLSFVRDAEDIERARAALPKRGHRPLIVAKIETRSALQHLDAIAEAADAVMVARGDLGIQTPLSRVPLLQKQIIRICNQLGRPVITATQMLESMTRSPLPTRAEVADVANAVLDGTDALMLSEETAVGQHALETVRTMAETAIAAEQGRPLAEPAEPHSRGDHVSWAVAHAAVEAATDLRVSAILCPTRSGSTARRVAAYRPSMQIVGLSSRSETLGGLALSWGVLPLATEDLPEALDMRDEVERAVVAARSAGVVQSGDLVTVVAGSPGPRAGRTDFMRVVRA
ncbi:MAG: pyruvate kinase [Actinomycetota bacterium]